MRLFSALRPVDEWILAPAYDLVATAVVLPADEDETALTLSGKRRRLRPKDFYAFGTSTGIPENVSARLVHAVLRRTDTMIATVERSSLAPAARERFVGIIKERAERLRA